MSRISSFVLSPALAPRRIGLRLALVAIGVGAMLPAIAFAQAKAPAAKPPAARAPAGKAAAGDEAPAAAAPGAKKYKSIETPKALGDKSPERARIQREMQPVLRGETPLDDNGKRDLESWFVQITLAKMTLPQSTALADLARARQDLRARYFRPMAKPESDAVRAYVNELFLTNTIKIAGDAGYHPAVRVNAMLILGDLNQREAAAAGGGAAAAPAVPLPAALTQRGGLLAAASDTAMAPAVRAAALVGVARHAQIGIPTASQGAVQTAMLDIVKEKPGNTLSSGAADWIKSRAAETLGAMGNPGTGSSVAIALAAVLGDGNASISVRCAAARALGNLKTIDAGALKLADVVAGLGNLQLEICRDELARAAAAGDGVSAKQIHFRTAAVNAAFAGNGKTPGLSKSAKADAPEKALLDGVAKSAAAILALVPDDSAQPEAELKTQAEGLEKLLADAKALRVKPSTEAAPATTPATTPPPTTPAATTPADKAADAKAADASGAAAGAAK